MACRPSPSFASAAARHGADGHPDARASTASRPPADSLASRIRPQPKVLILTTFDLDEYVRLQKMADGAGLARGAAAICYPLARPYRASAGYLSKIFRKRGGPFTAKLSTKQACGSKEWNWAPFPFSPRGKPGWAGSPHAANHAAPPTRGRLPPCASPARFPT